MVTAFDWEKVNREIGAQLQITSTFGQQAGRAIGDYADGRAKELRAQGREEDARKWDEGGVYRSAAHAAIGAPTEGAAGALGAGAAALSADAINRAVADLPPALRQVVGGAIAVGIGAAAGGGAGAATAFNADFNNRQLHPTESQWIKDNAGRYAQQQGIDDATAQRQLAQQAYRQVQVGVAGAWDEGASTFLNQARSLLPADPATPALGIGSMFHATADQRAAAQMYAGTLPAQADFYAANSLTIPSAQAIASGAARDGRQRELLGQLTAGAGIAAGVIALAGASPTLLAWALANPDKAATTGLISAETAAGIASGAITPGSVADGLGQGVGRSLTAAERAAVQELGATLRGVAQQRAVVVQTQRVEELTNVFGRGNAGTLEFAGQRYAATAESNLGGTTKVFDTSGLSGPKLESQVFGYARELSGGQPLMSVLRDGVPLEGRWTAKLPDGATINVRSVSSSNVGRWTVDIQDSAPVQTAAGKKTHTNFEIKFK